MLGVEMFTKAVLLRHESDVQKPTEMFSFSSNLWFEKRRVNQLTGVTSLYLQIVIDGKHKEFRLKLKWPAKLVDLKNGRLLPRIKNDPDVSDYNLIIEAERAKHTEIFRIYRIKQEYIDLSKFSNELKVFNMRECFSAYLDAERLRRFARGEISKRTSMNAHVVLMRMLDFDKLCLFRMIDVSWMKKFKAFLNKKDYLPSTVWGIIKVVKSYLKLASLEPTYFVDQKAVEFPNKMPRFTTTFLKKSEIDSLIGLQKMGALTAIEESVLKAFLFTCFTSIRISDLYLANINWRVESDFLDFIPYKGRKRHEVLRIPLIPIAKSFIQNLNGKFFDLPSMPEYNRTLKDLAVKAKINKKLTAHVGRHTYGFLYMTTVGNLKALQELLGHKSIKTTQRYAHLDDTYLLESVTKLQAGFNFILSE